ncbi:MAG TPA: ribonuclease P protein component [Alphaproteobacteria bacterium]|nr:ribonuclease P protein component [Alphaproteobacteria bacterium]
MKHLPTLRRRREFLVVAEKGRKWAAPGLVLQIGAAGEQKEMAAIRYGLTATRKIGNAVKRNRARRRLRALACEILPLHAAPGRDYVLVARDATATRAYADLRRDLEAALRKLGAWRDCNDRI